MLELVVYAFEHIGEILQRAYFCVDYACNLMQRINLSIL